VSICGVRASALVSGDAEFNVDEICTSGIAGAPEDGALVVTRSSVMNEAKSMCAFIGDRSSSKPGVRRSLGAIASIQRGAGFLDQRGDQCLHITEGQTLTGVGRTKHGHTASPPLLPATCAAGAGVLTDRKHTAPVLADIDSKVVDMRVGA
jgi:hypothetical protein